MVMPSRPLNRSWDWKIFRINHLTGDPCSDPGKCFGDWKISSNKYSQPNVADVSLWAVAPKRQGRILRLRSPTAICREQSWSETTDAFSLCDFFTCDPVDATDWAQLMPLSSWRIIHAMRSLGPTPFHGGRLAISCTHVLDLS